MMSDKSSIKVTIPQLQARKKQGRKIISLTAYDFPTALILDEVGIDLILVGDSLGMVVLGYETTVPVTMEDVLHHTRAVTRAVQKALVISDMPYLSFQLDIKDALVNAARFVKEAGAQGVKIEGASPQRIQVIEKLVEADIPVMGHVGLTPQSINYLGQFRMKGKTEAEARNIMDGALRLEDAGVFSIVLECIPRELAAQITRRVSIPTIGIGAGPECDGQILVLHDMIGLSSGYLPKFVRRYADLHGILSEAVRSYADDIHNGKFPGAVHCYGRKTSKASNGSPDNSQEEK